MAIIGEHIRITYRYTWQGQQCQNTQYWTPIGAAFLTADMIDVLEAYWNDLQPTLEPLMPSSSAVGSFLSLLGEEIGTGNQFAEFAVPVLDQQGSRSGLTDADIPSSFTAFGFRQTVGTRATRPGQKRFPWMAENDIDGNELDSSFITLIEPLAEHFTTPRVLGAPVATGALYPVVGGTEVGGEPTVWQDITGFVINPDVTSQVSRKKGRGI